MTEKKMPTRNLERVAERKAQTYHEAYAMKQKIVSADGPPPAKAKIFARNDGTYDVVTYRKVGEKRAKTDEVIVEQITSKAQFDSKVEGRRAKQGRPTSRKEKTAWVPKKFA